MDFVAKPKLDVARGLESYAAEICAKVKTAARSRVRALAVPAQARRTLDTIAPSAAGAPSLVHRDHLIAIGASAGGTEALRVVLEMMPADAPAASSSPGTAAGQFQRRLRRTPGPPLGDVGA